ncbi:hypothetical protein [Mucilaginibacter dorajii]|uniref:Uncharacterized protein n=1 Tax=Mucilaginibacter dorajii TaxID=692994 RepID=A0ABP7R106_9SPHI|nr:hypothetical protein [Mucilaginibacter dorajii]MCS3732200.1 hypothetical protein [Mucilaginibacter dorajii]
MRNSQEIQDIQKCLELIETRLNWGPSQEWTGYDFEKLSVEIQAVTSVILSVTTLKRLWGKLTYTSMPTGTTLNTLAQFAGFKDWREFKHQIRLDQSPAAGFGVPPLNVPLKPIRTKKTYWLTALLLMLIAGCALFLFQGKTTAPVDTKAYQFSSNKIKTEGVPNSVIFNYDAAAAGTNAVFIAQSWDLRRKVAVPQQGHVYSTLYYQPGYYRAKLLVGNQIVKEHDLMISSGGWVAMIAKDGGAPLYFKKDEVLKNKVAAVNQAILSKYNVPLQPSLPALHFFNVRDMGGIRNDRFIFETTLKSDFHQGSAACQRVEVLILCKNDVINIPLSSSGCVGDLSLYAAGTKITSKSADMSKFGCDLDQWVKLRVESQNGKIRFFINGREAYSLHATPLPTAIVGVEYRFNGTGAIKDTRFLKDRQVINF